MPAQTIAWAAPLARCAILDPFEFANADLSWPGGFGPGSARPNGFTPPTRCFDPSLQTGGRAVGNCNRTSGGNPNPSSVVVNDGSGPEFGSLFLAFEGLARVHVLTHVVNLGKGAALKTGLNFVACNFPRAVGVVTADADGQHAVHDILRVCRSSRNMTRQHHTRRARFQGGRASTEQDRQRRNQVYSPSRNRAKHFRHPDGIAGNTNEFHSDRAAFAVERLRF